MLRCILAALVALVLFTVCIIPDDAYARCGGGGGFHGARGGAIHAGRVGGATRGVPEHERGDVMGAMFIAIGENRLKLSEATARVGEFVRTHRYRPRVPGDPYRSLDIPVGEDGSMRFGDQFTEGLWSAFHTHDAL
jgi:hypothetical protein